ncbi:hypothetical protein EMIHUDRAFT_360632 [Emiliania huxleyi CCMP1516]|uniref:UBA domain-containing protein n=2 Tax=Emiliania huxleyi TaxID=2903 RepID=A0A0D3HXN8_EMIH1|nr:hypothetical protein EMIHUDRAFT_360632 [Emiliania huxleyi CCMP1516]EOD03773.1 hypothetical protein EMIHUDRAFT_360632 [Emiliania huxleyi CCMP1516]|eukprot:XP_005756202.1 hypothetical protein EMIHUDRAFT_360632 [Emiliania huxleyi CCMP1516]
MDSPADPPRVVHGTPSITSFFPPAAHPPKRQKTDEDRAAARLSADDKFEAGVAQLLEMGYGETDARGALRHSAANVQAAVERLLHGVSG